MAKVYLREIGEGNRADCLALRVANFQADFVAPNAESLSAAAAEPKFLALAIYDADQEIMVGFTMCEFGRGVGFIRRLMIDERFQRRGYGRAAMVEVIRLLELHPEVNIIATRHRRENLAAGMLYQSLGFRVWDSPDAPDHPDEVYLKRE